MITREVDALLGEDPLLLQASPAGGVGVRRDRDARLAVRDRRGAQDALDVRREPRRVDRALQDRGLGPAGALDPLADVADEQLDEHVALLRRTQHVAVVEVLGQLVRREDTRRQDDVEVDLLGHALHERGRSRRRARA
jgi:hypothetical protein